MHILKIPDGLEEPTAPIPVGGGKSLESGQSYICTNAFVGSLLMTKWRVNIKGETWALSPLLNAIPFVTPAFNPEEDWNGRDIWMMRGGGWGDLLMLTPLIRELKKRWPKCKIYVSRADNFAGAFEGLDVEERQVPIPTTDISPIGILVAFEETIEGNPAAERVHMAQQFADMMGIDLEGDYKPDLILSAEEKAWQEENFPKTGKKRIGIQIMASALYRTYPNTDPVIKALLEREYEVFMFGAKGQINLNGEPPPGLTNLTDPKYDSTFRRSCAVVASCDCIVAPDSSMVHVAAALEVPCVGLYGPIPPQLRGSGKVMTGIQGMAPCSPCFFHATKTTDFPANGPCQETNYCIALAQITPEQIVEAVLKHVSPIIQLAPRKIIG